MKINPLQALAMASRVKTVTAATRKAMAAQKRGDEDASELARQAHDAYAQALGLEAAKLHELEKADKRAAIIGQFAAAATSQAAKLSPEIAEAVPDAQSITGAVAEILEGDSEADHPNIEALACRVVHKLMPEESDADVKSAVHDILEAYGSDLGGAHV